jgi:hypothetical protein
MRKTLIASAVATVMAGAGAAMAQEAPYTVMDGQVIYPGQMQWNAPVGGAYSMTFGSGGYYGDRYVGGASIAPGARVYVPSGGPYYVGPNYMAGEALGSGYNGYGPGASIFERGNINSDQNYNGR